MCRLSAAGEVLYDTRQRGKPLVYLYGSRPFTNGICIGVEEGLAGMKAGERHATGWRNLHPKTS